MNGPAIHQSTDSAPHACVFPFRKLHLLFYRVRDATLSGRSRVTTRAAAAASTRETQGEKKIPPSIKARVTGCIAFRPSSCCDVPAVPH